MKRLKNKVINITFPFEIYPLKKEEYKMKTADYVIKKRSQGVTVKILEKDLRSRRVL